VVQIADLPASLGPFGSGPYWLDRVTHRITAREAITRASLRQGGPAFDPLATLTGAVGGLVAGL
jgi:hypothetical protein